MLLWDPLLDVLWNGFADVILGMRCETGCCPTRLEKAGQPGYMEPDLQNKLPGHVVSCTNHPCWELSEFHHRMTEKEGLPIQNCFVGLDNDLESFIDHFKISVCDEYLPVIELGFIVTSKSARVESQISCGTAQRQ